MSVDIYEPCPCGSGKKLKFCCAEVSDDMDRVVRLLDGGQHRQALHHLETVIKRRPQNMWANITRAVLLMETGDAQAAREALKAFLADHPEHDLAAVYYAAAELELSGLDVAKPVIHRAFQRCAKRHPRELAGLAHGMSGIYQDQGHLLAAREHMVLALRFAGDEQRQRIFMNLLEFDNDASIPYPLRSVHALPTIDGDEALQTAVRKALKYATVGCWSTAADQFEELANAQPDDARRWHAVGLCRAWDADEPRAAVALHQAAKLYADRATAVECETLAQLLDWEHTDDKVRIVRTRGTISSVGRLLTAFDAEERFARLQMPPRREGDPPQPTAMYAVLDRNRNEAPAPKDLTEELVPRVLATIYVIDPGAETRTSPLITVAGPEEGRYEAAVQLVQTAAADLVTWEPGTEDIKAMPRALRGMEGNWWFPPKTPYVIQRKLSLDVWSRYVTQTWFEAPLPALDGRTPRQCAGESSDNPALTAAVYVLDAQSLGRGFSLDIEAQLQALGLSPLPLLDVAPEASLSTLTALQWMQVPLDRLSDAQTLQAVNRGLLVHHDRFLVRVLESALQRASCKEELDLDRVYRTLTELARSRGDRVQLFQWLQAGRTHAQSEPNNFEKVWMWDLLELTFRLDDPTDPELQSVVDRFVNYYGRKLPQTMPYVQQLLSSFDLPFPSGGIVTSASTPAPPHGGGLWTPDAPAEPVGAGKLWLPGQ